jgi:quinolinate synthase
MYVNTSAEVKAESDYCCTSSNAVKVVEHVLLEHGSDTKILFGPDMWLGSYVERVTGHAIEVWPGECHVHAGIRPEDITRVREQRPESEFLIHPECACATQCMEYVAAGVIEPGGCTCSLPGRCSTTFERTPTGASSSPPRPGCSIRCEGSPPTHSLTPANEKAVFKYMKMITLPNLRDSLREMKHEVKVPEEIAERARVPIERMVAIG